MQGLCKQDLGFNLQLSNGRGRAYNRAASIMSNSTANSGVFCGPGRQAFACDPAHSRGRLFAEPESPMRGPYQRDRDRIVHSTAFRRLKHKTQVFVFHEGDHYRTRLTHSLEVAQIARAIARALGLDEDLSEALALAHDLGHTPFGHAGEEALDEAMAPWGGFDHNVQTFRILTVLERRYAAFDGLNLTWETLEGIVKHNGPLIGAGATAKNRARDTATAFADFCARQVDLRLDTWPSAEAQVAALADDIAYNNHDIDDGLRAGLFAVADMAEAPLAGPIFAGMAARHPGIEETRLIHEAVRHIINEMVTDLVAETTRRIGTARPQSADAVRTLGGPLVAFSDAMEGHNRSLKRFLFEHMYRHERVNRMTDRAREVVAKLFAIYRASPARLPAEWRSQGEGRDEAGMMRLIADYIAGMTDGYALQDYARLSGEPVSAAI
jgi:dGTPase